jgi:hypothetical protein
VFAGGSATYLSQPPVPVIALTGDFSACAPHVTLARQLAWNFAATNKDFFDLNDGKSPASQLKQHLDLDEMPMPTTVPYGGRRRGHIYLSRLLLFIEATSPLSRLTLPP